jgi:hypothetical protein
MIDAEREFSLEVSLHDILGKPVFQKSILHSGEAHLTELDVRAVPQGLYLLTLYSPDIHRTADTYKIHIIK